MGTFDRKDCTYAWNPVLEKHVIKQIKQLWLISPRWFMCVGIHSGPKGQNVILIHIFEDILITHLMDGHENI